MATFAVVLLVSTPSPVLAHGALKSSVPAKGAHLTAAPRELRLTFTEAPELTFTRVELIGPDGRPVTLDTIRAVADSARAIVAPIAGPLIAGGYTVRWQIAGADGHPVRGSFAFTIVQGAQGLAGARGSPGGEAGASVTAPRQTPPAAEHHDPVTMPGGEGFAAESPLYVAIRWLTFTGILTVLGAVAFHHLVLGFLRRQHDSDAPFFAPASARAATLGLWAAFTLGILTLLRLYAQSYALHGARQALNGALIGSMLGRTMWGWGWLLQVAAVVTAVLAFRAARRGSGTAWGLAALAAIALAFTPALSGHAAAAPRLTPLAILADGLHVIGAGGWLGSLLILLAAGIPAATRLVESERGPAVAKLVNAFSPTALLFAGIAAATGVFAAWLHIGTVSGLWQSSYGRTLLLKLAILSIVAGTGAYNWLRVKPALGDAIGTGRIRRSATVELAVAVLVLAVTAALVATPTAMDERMMSGEGSRGSAPSVASPSAGTQVPSPDAH